MSTNSTNDPRHSKNGGTNFTPEANAEAAETGLGKDETLVSSDEGTDSGDHEGLRRNCSLNSALRTRLSHFTYNRQASDSSLLVNRHHDFIRLDGL